MLFLRTILIWVFLFLSLVVISQENKPDQQSKSFSNSADTSRANTMRDLAESFRKKGEYDSAEFYARRSLEISEKSNFIGGKGEAYNALGNVFYMRGDFTAALTNYAASLQCREQAGNEKSIASSYTNLGNVYYSMGNYPEALSYFFKGLRTYEAVGSKKQIADSYNNIGAVYRSQGNGREAMKNHSEALSIRKAIGDKKGICDSYVNLGNLLLDDEKYEEAKTNYINALAMATEMADKQAMAACYDNIAAVQVEEENLQEALKNFFVALSIRKDLGSKDLEEMSLINIGSTFLLQKKYKDAESYLLSGKKLAEEVEDLEGMRDADENLAELYEKKGEFKKAFAYYRNFIRESDSLTNEENTKRTVRLEMNYQFEKREALLRSEQEKKDMLALAEDRRQKLILLSIIGVLLLVLVFAIYAYRSYLEKKRANEEIMHQKGLIEEKQKEILDSIYYARRIQRSLLPNEKYVSKHLSRLLSSR